MTLYMYGQAKQGEWECGTKSAAALLTKSPEQSLAQLLPVHSAPQNLLKQAFAQ